MAFDPDTEASGPRLLPLAIAGWGAAFGVSLLMLWAALHYRVSVEVGIVPLGLALRGRVCGHGHQPPQPRLEQWHRTRLKQAIILLNPEIRQF